jgi:hypothetical protein
MAGTSFELENSGWEEAFGGAFGPSFESFIE